MINNNKISVIIPAYNEMEFISETLTNLSMEWIDEVIVVNDGSTDRTKDIVKDIEKDYQIVLINLPTNSGKGRAVTEGIYKSSGDILLTIDADLGKSVCEIKKLINPLVEKDYEATVAILPIIGGGLGIVRKVAEFGVKNITGKIMKAPLSGQRAYRREIINKILPLKPGFAMEMGINIDFFNYNIKFIEVECLFTHRVSGQSLSGYKHRFRQFKDIIKYLWELKKEKYVLQK